MMGSVIQNVTMFVTTKNGSYEQELLATGELKRRINARAKPQSER